MTCSFDGNINDFNELSGYIDLFSNKGLINKNKDLITKLALLVHSDKSKNIPGIDTECISRSVNGYLNYLTSQSDLDKSISHFFQLKQNVNSSNIGIELIDPTIFSNPFKVASYIKFITVNEINNMFNLDYYNSNLSTNIDNKFLKFDEFLKKYSNNYSNIHEAADEYYFYLVKTYTAYFEYYALYDYLLCYSYHLEEFGKTLIENKQIAGKYKKTKYRRYKTKKSRNKKHKNKKKITKKFKRHFTKRAKIGGVKDAFVEQNTLLAFAKRSPLWASLGTGTFTAAGVTLSGIVCSIAAPFIYDICTTLAEETTCSDFSFLPSDFRSIVGAGLLTGTAAAISLMAGAKMSSDSISIPYAESGIIFKREPKELKTIQNISNKDGQKEKLMNVILSEETDLAERISQLQEDLAKFNLYVIDDRFITDNAVNKFRLIFKEYIVIRLKEVFDVNVAEMIELYKNKLITEKIQQTNPNLSKECPSLEKTINNLSENMNRLSFTKEELVVIETSVRSKVAGLIIAQAGNLVEREVTKGRQGRVNYEVLSSVDKISLPGQQSSLSVLNQTENETITNVIALITSLVHIESVNNFVFSQKVTSHFIAMNWLYIIGWSIFSNFKASKRVNDYIFIGILIIIFFGLLVQVLGNFGFDPINSDEIAKSARYSETDIKEADKIYAKLREEKTDKSAFGLNFLSNDSEMLCPVDEANKFVEHYRQSKEMLIKSQEEYNKATQDCKNSYSSAFFGCTNTWQTWMGTFMPWIHFTTYQARAHPSVIGITTTPYFSIAKMKMLRVYAFGSFVSNNWLTVGGLIGIGVAYNNIYKIYGRFTGEIKNLVEELDREITPYKFNLKDIYKEVQDNIDRGGGTLIKEAIAQIQRTIETAARTNEAIQRAQRGAYESAGFEFRILEELREQERLKIEQERLKIDVERLDIEKQQLGIQQQVSDGAEKIQENIETKLKSLSYTFARLKEDESPEEKLTLEQDFARQIEEDSMILDFERRLDKLKNNPSDILKLPNPTNFLSKNNLSEKVPSYTS